MGCTAQEWLEVKMDNSGVMKFRVDSDSEITKGFCSCLIWVLDGAKFEEILTVQADDLREMNVGLPSRGHSRVNTWHNVLISMQKRTKDLVDERNGQTIPFLIHDVTVNGSYKETQIGLFILLRRHSLIIGACMTELWHNRDADHDGSKAKHID
ncbi:SufE-like protein 2 [Forsythia ovata]|uniref:SufE-like protein 2 n=1 Tax=Forsythia ovata TaxID=205694 RepID=A0ABD1W5M8_9LAMI